MKAFGIVDRLMKEIKTLRANPKSSFCRCHLPTAIATYIINHKTAKKQHNHRGFRRRVPGAWNKNNKFLKPVVRIPQKVSLSPLKTYQDASHSFVKNSDNSLNTVLTTR